MDGEQTRPMLSYAGPEPARRGTGFLRAAVSLLVPGLGQWIAARRRRGVVWFAVVNVLMVTGLALMAARGRVLWTLCAVLPLAVAAPWACVIDAYFVGRSGRECRPRSPWARYAIGIGAVVLWLYAGAYARLSMALRPYWSEAYVATNAAMAPTIVPGDRFLVSKVGRTWRRWEIVALYPPEAKTGPRVPGVKRIAGLPGETIEIRGGVVYVDQAPVPPPKGLGPFTYPTSRLEMFGTHFPPVTLGPGEYYVLGDNAAASADSRLWDRPVLERDLIGHVTLTYWPLQRWKVMD